MVDGRHSRCCLACIHQGVRGPAHWTPLLQLIWAYIGGMIPAEQHVPDAVCPCLAQARGSCELLCAASAAWYLIW